jgi:MFS family permease
MGMMPDGTPITPLPKKKITALVICSMTWGFQMNIIFPFMPFMVDWMRGTSVDSGFYVGIMASAYFWGQFVASFIWPPLSDKIGRKKSLIWGQFALTIPFMCFALSRNYWWAVFWRFVNGVLQSNSPITKAYIADICDRTNSGAGMSVLAFAWGLSNVRCTRPLQRSSGHTLPACLPACLPGVQA